MNRTRRSVLAGALLAPVALAVVAPGRARADDHRVSVYFRADEVELSADAQQAANSAVFWLSTSGGRGMEIIGHTDTAEDPSLAMQRAVATKTYLLAHGLSPQLPLSLRAAAPGDLPVPTGPGVHEPLNRAAVMRIY